MASLYHPKTHRTVDATTLWVKCDASGAGQELGDVRVLLGTCSSTTAHSREVGSPSRRVAWRQVSLISLSRISAIAEEPVQIIVLSESKRVEREGMRRLMQRTRSQETRRYYNERVG
jgi:hypothetical protein